MHEELVIEEQLNKLIESLEEREKENPSPIWLTAPRKKLKELSIDFETRQVEELEDGKKYTIEELCGSEEIEILEPTYTTIEEKEKLKENNESN